MSSWLDVKNYATGQNSTSGNSLTIFRPGTTVPVGDILIMSVACDNTTTTTGASNDITSVTDTHGTWSKLGEYTMSSGAAGDGTTCAMFMQVITGSTYASGGSVTINFGSSITSKAGIIRQVTNASGTAVVAGSIQYGSGAGSPSLTLSGLPSREYLFFRAMATEAETTGLSVSSGFTAGGGSKTATGSGATGQSVVTEFKFATATGATSSPLLGSGDSVGMFVAFAEAQVYSMTIDSGSYTDSTYSANLVTNRNVNAGSASVSSTGYAAVLGYGRGLNTTSGSYTSTGHGAGFKWSHKLAVGSGSFAATPYSVTTIHPRRITVSSGSFTVTQRNPVVDQGHTLSAVAGVFGVTGYPVGLNRAGSNAMLYIKTVAPNAPGVSHEGYVYTANTFTGAIDITTDIRCRKQLRTDTAPFAYEVPRIRFAITGGFGANPLVNYAFTLYPTQWQLSRINGSNGTNGVMASGSLISPIGIWSRVRISYDPSSGAIIAWVNGTLVTTVTDSFPLPQGRYGFSTTNSWAEFDNVSGSIQDDFNNYTVANWGQLDTVGNWYVYYLEGNTDLAGIEAGMPQINAVSGSFGTTFPNATLKPSATYKIYTDSGTFGVSGNAITEPRYRLFNINSGTFIESLPDVGTVVGLALEVSTANFVARGFDPDVTFSTGPGRSRASTMMMFAQHHQRTQSDIRRKIASTLPITPPLKTPLEPIVPTRKAMRRNSTRTTNTVLPPKPNEPTSNAPNRPNLRVVPRNNPDDDDVLSMLLQ